MLERSMYTFYTLRAATHTQRSLLDNKPGNTRMYAAMKDFIRSGMTPSFDVQRAHGCASETYSCSCVTNIENYNLHLVALIMKLFFSTCVSRSVSPSSSRPAFSLSWSCLLSAHMLFFQLLPVFATVRTPKIYTRAHLHKRHG